MKIILCLLPCAFALHIVKMPFGKGANIPESMHAPDVLQNAITTQICATETYEIDMDRIYRQSFGDVFMKIWSIMSAGNFVLNIGGDHSTAIPTVFASNEVCRSHGDVLGVLWCDAHTDINTPETSPSGNIHGMPVAVLLGKTLPILSFGEALDPSQIGYFGVRDIDEPEQDTVEALNIDIHENAEEVKKWMDKFDKIHISFDVDALEDMSSCSTPVPDGIPVEVVKEVFKYAKKSGKLVSMDVVEYCPKFDKNHKDLDTIVDIIRTVT